VTNQLFLLTTLCTFSILYDSKLYTMNTSYDCLEKIFKNVVQFVQYYNQIITLLFFKITQFFIFIFVVN